MDELSGGSPVRPALSDADDAEADQQIDDDEPDDDDESRMFSEKDVEVDESVTVPRNGKHFSTHNQITCIPSHACTC